MADHVFYTNSVGTIVRMDRPSDAARKLLAKEAPAAPSGGGGGSGVVSSLARSVWRGLLYATAKQARLNAQITRIATSLYTVYGDKATELAKELEGARQEKVAVDAKVEAQKALAESYKAQQTEKKEEAKEEKEAKQEAKQEAKEATAQEYLTALQEAIAGSELTTRAPNSAASGHKRQIQSALKVLEHMAKGTSTSSESPRAVFTTALEHCRAWTEALDTAQRKKEAYTAEWAKENLAKGVASGIRKSASKEVMGIHEAAVDVIGAAVRSAGARVGARKGSSDARQSVLRWWSILGNMADGDDHSHDRSVNEVAKNLENAIGRWQSYQA
jgi:hypothetical protein